MKIYDIHFEDYIEKNKSINLHPKLDSVYNKFPQNIQNLRNLIFYGPKGVGKYTQMLSAIKQYRPSELKYEKKNKYNL
jgi:DNA replication protein DnaC